MSELCEPRVSSMRVDCSPESHTATAVWACNTSAGSNAPSAPPPGSTALLQISIKRSVRVQANGAFQRDLARQLDRVAGASGDLRHD